MPISPSRPDADIHADTHNDTALFRSKDMQDTLADLEQTTDFIRRHIGPGDDAIAAMLRTVGADSLNDLVHKALPASILEKAPPATGYRPHGPHSTA